MKVRMGRKKVDLEMVERVGEEEKRNNREEETKKKRKPKKGRKSSEEEEKTQTWLEEEVVGEEKEEKRKKRRKSEKGKEAVEIAGGEVAEPKEKDVDKDASKTKRKKKKKKDERVKVDEDEIMVDPEKRIPEAAHDQPEDGVDGVSAAFSCSDPISGPPGGATSFVAVSSSGGSEAFGLP